MEGCANGLQRLAAPTAHARQRGGGDRHGAQAAVVEAPAAIIRPAHRTGGIAWRRRREV